jgi:asparagine synthase (glutamine-hydrolysing)
MIAARLCHTGATLWSAAYGQGGGMCGIVGTIDTVEGRARARVDLLNQAQQHRGPDHSAIMSVGAFTLGNTRLAIQDPGPSGNQPFVSSDGRYHCVFNGEIYNYRRLAEDYQLPMRTSCDGEVIPHLWAKLGLASLAEIRGMFAIAIVDALDERLYLARDPFGIKPLYWRVLPDGRLVFASEVRPLTRVMTGTHLSGPAIARYLRLGAIAADQSPFDEITALPPNSVACFGLDGRATVTAIRPGGPLAMTCAPDDLGTALAESIDLHLGADVPTALLLSGGTDSATIAAIGQRLGRRLHCLTVATLDAEDESDEAAQTARHYGHRFERIPVALETSDMAKFFAAMQRPTIDGLNTYLVSKAVHDAGFKVALSGLGGDEAVGGYGHFRILRLLRTLRILERAPGPVIGIGARTMARLGIAGQAKARRLLSAGGPREGSAMSLLQREVLQATLISQLTGIATGDDVAVGLTGTDAATPFAAMVAAEVAIYLQAMLLPDADAFSMASSVELRVPFVDSQVFASSLALAAGAARHPGKPVIGDLLNDPYLKALAARRKRGFSVPMRQWMAGPLAPVLKAAEDPGAPVWSMVDRAAAQRAGLIPLIECERWAEGWVIAALNAWIGTIAG